MKPQFIIIGILGILFLFIIMRPKRMTPVYITKMVPVSVPVVKKVPVYKNVRFAKEEDPVMYAETGEYERDDVSRYLGGYPQGIDLEYGSPLYTKRWIGGGFYNGSYKTYVY